MLNPSHIIESLIALTELKEALGTGRQKHKMPDSAPLRFSLTLDSSVFPYGSN